MKELKTWVLATAIAVTSAGAGLIGVWVVVSLNGSHDDPAPVVHGNSYIKPPEARPGPPVPPRKLPGYPIERLREAQKAAGK